jgi:hypothetical protein
MATVPSGPNWTPRPPTIPIKKIYLFKTYETGRTCSTHRVMCQKMVKKEANLKSKKVKLSL